MQTFRAALWKQDNWYIAQCLDVDVVTQAGSEMEAGENMQEALSLHFDAPQSDIFVVLEQEPGRASAEASQAARTFLQVRLRLESAGFRGITQRPNHAKFIKSGSDKTLSAILPHYTELAQAVILSILRQAELPLDEFERQ